MIHQRNLRGVVHVALDRRVEAALTGDERRRAEHRERDEQPDRERGALKRLAAIMSRYPALTSYVQTDPRGAPLYLLREGDVPEGADAASYYNNGIAIHA